MNKLIVKLDKIFSWYIRLRDADENGNVRCISCGKVMNWKEADCGHFIKRQHLATRFSELNCHAQCRICNWLKQGNDVEYEKALIKKIGQDKVNLLKSRQTVKYSNFELEYMIKDYSEKVNQLKKQKG